MKHYKDDCHHYKVIDKHRAIAVTDLGEFSTSISFENYGGITHYIIKAIEKKTVKPCTQKEYQTAFDKALKTIKNVK